MFGSNQPQTLPKALDAEQRTFASTRSGNVSYYLDQQATGRPLVLIHSINAAPSAFEMKPLFTHFRTERPVYALDLPGFGFSERRDLRYSPALYVETIGEFLTNEVGEAADIIALSLGCEFAAMSAQAYPDLVRSLTLISPTGMGKPRSLSPSTSSTIYKAVSVPLWSDSLYALLTSHRTIRYYLSKSFAGTAPSAMIEYAYQTSHQPGARFAPFHFLAGHLFTWNVFETVYQSLSTPTLVLYDSDPNVDFDRLPNLLEQNPHWSAERIVPTRGLPHWEKLEETTRILAKFHQN